MKIKFHMFFSELEAQAFVSQNPSTKTVFVEKPTRDALNRWQIRVIDWVSTSRKEYRRAA